MASNNVRSAVASNVDMQDTEKDQNEERSPTMRQLLLPSIVFLYFCTYNMNTALTEKFLEYRVTKMILDQQHKAYIDLSGLNFCNLSFTDPRMLLFVELQIKLVPWRKNLYISSAVPGMIAASLLGPLSDRFGRRLILLMPLAGVIVRAVGYMVVSQTQASLSMLYIPHVLEGLFGFFPTFLMGAVTYVCDTTGRNKVRTILITLVCALAPVAQISYVYQVFAMQQWGYVYPNIFTMTFALATLILTFFLLPPSRSPPAQQQTLLTNFKNVVKIYCSRSYGTTIVYFHVGWFTFAVVSLVFYGQTIMEPIYSAIQPLCWDMTFSGNYEVFRGILQSVASVLIVVAAVPFFGDGLIAASAGIFQIAGFIIQGYSKTTILWSISSIFGLGTSITMTMIRVMMSKFIRDNAFGALFSVLASLEVLTSSISPLTFIQIYNHYAESNRGAVFFCMAGMIGLASLLYAAMHVGYKRRNRNTYIALQ